MTERKAHMLYDVLKSISLGQGLFVHKGQTLEGSALPDGRAEKLVVEGFLAHPKSTLSFPEVKEKDEVKGEEVKVGDAPKTPTLQDPNKKRSFVPDSLAELKLKDLNLLVKGIDATAPVFGVKKAAIDWLTVEYK
jgi:hypothetical protein